MTELTLLRISAETLHEELQGEERPVLINALSRDAYNEQRIPGSINIPTDDIKLAEQVIPDKTQPIVVYCANADCNASPEAAQALLDLGYENVRDFEEGLAGWRQAGYNLTGR